MKLEDQVCTLEQAKRLKELGVKNTALNYYYQYICNGETTYPVIPINNWTGYKFEYDDSLVRALDGESSNEIYAAYTVAELGEMLPCRIWVGDDMYSLFFWKADKNWHKISTGTETSYHYEYQFVNAAELIEVLGNHQCGGHTDAEGRASMLITLLENKLLII